MSLIINRPTECPQKYWDKVNDGKLEIRHERRPASYEIINTRDQTRRVQEIAVVNTIRGGIQGYRRDQRLGAPRFPRKPAR